MILQGLKPRIYDKLKKFYDKLKKFAGRWVAELPSMLWSLRTMPNKSTGFTPFFMTYSVEAMLPTELDYGSPRVRTYQEEQSEQGRQDNLDMLDEARGVALIQLAKYQQNLRRYHSRRIP